jgi:hypothetical protein
MFWIGSCEVIKEHALMDSDLGPGLRRDDVGADGTGGATEE